MAQKKKTSAPKAARSNGAADPGWTEEESTMGARWWIPDEDEPDHAIVVQVIERKDGNATRFGDRTYFICRALEDCADSATDEKGAIKRGDMVIVWESAALRDLARWAGEAVAVKIVPNARGGSGGRTRLYRLFTRPLRDGAQKQSFPKGERGAGAKSDGDIPF